MHQHTHADDDAAFPSLTHSRAPILEHVQLRPQYTLSFLHRMTQEWKSKYIDWFVATSPVWSGSPAALSVFSTGYAGFLPGAPVPNAPPECKKLTLYENICFSGAVAMKLSTDLAGCCKAISDAPGVRTCGVPCICTRSRSR